MDLPPPPSQWTFDPSKVPPSFDFSGKGNRRPLWDLSWAFEDAAKASQTTESAQDDFESKVAQKAPVTDFHGHSLDKFRNDTSKPVLGTNYLQMYIHQADASGLGTRERQAALILLPEEDREMREKINDIVPRSIAQLDNYLPGAHRFHYTNGNHLLRMDVLELRGSLRVTAEIIMGGSKGTISHGITGSDTPKLGNLLEGDRTGYNYWRTVCMTVRRNGAIQWFGDAFLGEMFKATLVDPKQSAPKLIAMLRKLVLPDKE